MTISQVVAMTKMKKKKKVMKNVKVAIQWERIQTIQRKMKIKKQLLKKERRREGRKKVVRNRKNHLNE